MKATEVTQADVEAVRVSMLRGGVSLDAWLEGIHREALATATRDRAGLLERLEACRSTASTPLSHLACSAIAQALDASKEGLN